jgi:hypothetical protein
MGRWRLCASLAAALAWASAGGSPVQSASQISLQRDGAVTIAGRVLRCGSVRNVLDPRLPNLGIAAPGVLVLNPGLLNRQSESVRLFVFHHECGHHHVGGSELKADCWAVRRGVDDGWLDGNAVKAICASFHDAPATPTHPSGARRCHNVDQCFATAVAARDRRQSVTAAAKKTAPEPQLVSPPTLISNGTVSYSGAATGSTAAGK